MKCIAVKFTGTNKKVRRIEMVNLLIKAKESVFTEKFHKKVDDIYIKEILEEVKS
jgi:hypothetical protein